MVLPIVLGAAARGVLAGTGSRIIGSVLSHLAPYAVSAMRGGDEEDEEGSGPAFRTQAVGVGMAGVAGALYAIQNIFDHHSDSAEEIADEAQRFSINLPSLKLPTQEEREVAEERRPLGQEIKMPPAPLHKFPSTPPAQSPAPAPPAPRAAPAPAPPAPAPLVKLPPAVKKEFPKKLPRAARQTAQALAGAKTLDEIAAEGTTSNRAKDGRKGFSGKVEIWVTSRGETRRIIATPEEEASVAYLSGKDASFSPGHGMTPSIRAMLEATADRHGIDRDSFVAMALYESGGNPNAVSPTGAVGLFQFMHGTRGDYNLANRFDPRANADAGARLWNDNARSLRKSLGREPELWELYLAHQQGASGSRQILDVAEGRNKTVTPGVQVAIIQQGAKYKDGPNKGKALVDPTDFAAFTKKSFNAKMDSVKADGVRPAEERSYHITEGYKYDPIAREVTVVPPPAAQAPPAITPAPAPAPETKSAPIFTQHPTLQHILQRLF